MTKEEALKDPRQIKIRDSIMVEIADRVMWKTRRLLTDILEPVKGTLWLRWQIRTDDKEIISAFWDLEEFGAVTYNAHGEVGLTSAIN